MAVDKKILDACIAQASGSDTELADFLRKKYEANDALAVSFVNGFTATADYTRKTQELSAERAKLGDTQKQIDVLKASVAAADSEKSKIMNDLAQMRISTAQANAMLDSVKETYNLTDDDIPGMKDLIATRKSGKVVDNSQTGDERLAQVLDSRFGDFEKRMEQKFLAEMTPELGAMAALPIVWDDITAQHRELFGTTLTPAQKREILAEARKGTDSSRGPGSLMGIWEDKFGIGGDAGVRVTKRIESAVAEEKKKWETESAAAASRAALSVVSGGDKQKDFSGAGVSPAFQTQFRQFPSDPGEVYAGSPKAGEVPTIPARPGEHVRNPGVTGTGTGTGKGDGANGGGPRVPASQRAAAKFVEKGGVGGYRKTA